MKKLLLALLILSLIPVHAQAVPQTIDLEMMTPDELIQLRANVNAAINETAMHTLWDMPYSTTRDQFCEIAESKTGAEFVSTTDIAMSKNSYAIQFLGRDASIGAHFEDQDSKKAGQLKSIEIEIQYGDESPESIDGVLAMYDALSKAFGVPTYAVFSVEDENGSPGNKFAPMTGNAPDFERIRADVDGAEYGYTLGFVWGNAVFYYRETPKSQHGKDAAMFTLRNRIFEANELGIKGFGVDVADGLK